MLCCVSGRWAASERQVGVGERKLCEVGRELEKQKEKEKGGGGGRGEAELEFVCT